MTTRVRFCVSYDPLKLDFIAYKMDIVSIRKRIADTAVVMMLHVHAIVVAPVLIAMFTRCLSGTYPLVAHTPGTEVRSY